MSYPVKKSKHDVIKEVCQKVTGRLIDVMKNSEVSWISEIVRSGRPMNYSTGKPYSGINWVILSVLQQYNSPCFMTFKQAQAAGYMVQPGEKSEQIFMYIPSYYEPDTKKKVPNEKVAQMSVDELKGLEMVPFMQYANVFNIDQLRKAEDGSVLIPFSSENRADCETVISAWKKGPTVSITDYTKAFYDSKKDELSIPHRWKYASPALYYCSIFHELVHATGHISRLNRLSLTDYENNRPFEELVAELGAAFLCNITGIQDEAVFNNNASYLQHWIEKMENDEKYFFRAAAAAQKAVDLIMADCNVTSLAVT